MKNSNALRALVSCMFLTSLPTLAHEVDESGKARLGTVKFATSCDPKLQADFERAVAMLHSFWYNAGEKAFDDIFAKDPTCAIAAWGYASILMDNPLGGFGSSPEGAKKAQAALAKAKLVGARTDRENDYIAAVSAYYDNWEGKPEKDRQLARSKAYEALAAKYPTDDEAQIFNALYIAGTQSQADQTYAAYLKAAAILEAQFKKYPDHPGVAHYLIHSYDAPSIAQKGLPAARVYAGIAPDAPHALHMPSHIFTRVGAWEESVSTNLRSAKVSQAANQPDQSYHACDYAVYAYLQLGRDEDARRTMEQAFSVKESNMKRFASPYAIAALPARYALERGDWKAAANLPTFEQPFAHVDAITAFARGLGAARSGDVQSAQKEAANLAAAYKKLDEAKNRYWGTEVEIQQLALAGWIAHKQGNAEEGAKLMRAAADLEDKNEKHIVTPGRVLPARELLGEMLFEQGQPAAALKEFEASQVREPNRLRNYWDSARAAEAMGDRAKAVAYYQKLVALTAKSDGSRHEVVLAKMALAQK
jgi:tetratricopeptide (TPR) repeat protein